MYEGAILAPFLFAQRSWQTRQAERSLITLTKGKII
jgi:hypothetical protein